MSRITRLKKRRQKRCSKPKWPPKWLNDEWNMIVTAIAAEIRREIDAEVIKVIAAKARGEEQ